MNVRLSTRKCATFLGILHDGRIRLPRPISLSLSSVPRSWLVDLLSNLVFSLVCLAKIHSPLSSPISVQESQRYFLLLHSCFDFLPFCIYLCSLKHFLEITFFLALFCLCPLAPGVALHVRLFKLNLESSTCPSSFAEAWPGQYNSPSGDEFLRAPLL